MTSRRSIRQRLWGSEDDKVSARAVGENLRNVDSAIASSPSIREVGFENVIYSAEGITFSASRRPRGAVVIHVEKIDGTWQSVSAVPELAFASSAVTAKISGLTVGERYAAIRLLVVG